MAERMVRFDEYCNSCKYKNITEDSEGLMELPCDECLEHPVNEDSRKPVYYEEEK